MEMIKEADTSLISVRGRRSRRKLWSPQARLQNFSHPERVSHRQYLKEIPGNDDAPLTPSSVPFSSLK